MYLDELLILENLYFAITFIGLSAMEQKLKPFIIFGGHLGGHLVFTHTDMPEVILMYLDELLILENLYFATTFIELSAMEQKL